MRKFLFVFALLGLTSTVFSDSQEKPAAASSSSLRKAGVYLGLQGGYGMTHWKYLEGSSYRSGIANIKHDQSSVSRAFLGYDINRYFAFETGYSYFFSKSSILYMDGVSTGTIRLQTVDLYSKIKAPIWNFDLYAKLGGGYLRETSSHNTSLNHCNVAFGAGTEYYITRNVIAGFEWLRIAGNPDATVKYIPDTDTLMVGLRFKL